MLIKWMVLPRRRYKNGIIPEMTVARLLRGIYTQFAHTVNPRQIPFAAAGLSYGK